MRTGKQTISRIDARKQTNGELYQTRLEIARLYREGVGVMEIVRRTGVSWPTVNAAIKSYVAGGDEALKPTRRGRKLGTGRELSPEQEAYIFKRICTRRPWLCGIKHPYLNSKIGLWNRDVVRQLIKDKLEIELSVKSVGQYLERWGFPIASISKRRPRDRCTRDVRVWLDGHYSVIEERARAENAKIFWVSKTELLNSEIGGVAESGNGRQMLFAITNQGKIHWMVIRGRFSPERQIKFMQILMDENREKIFLIRDDLKYYSRREAIDWLHENREKVELFPPLRWEPESKC